MAEIIITDRIEIQGRNIVAELFDKDGNRKAIQYIGHNMVTPKGKKHIANQLSSAPSSVVKYMWIGKGTPTTIALGSLEKGQAVTSYIASAKTVTYVATFTLSSTHTITEACLAVHAGTGTVLCTNATLLQLMNVTDALQITWPVGVV
jgi:hypothetical protein